VLDGPRACVRVPWRRIGCHGACDGVPYARAAAWLLCIFGIIKRKGGVMRELPIVLGGSAMER